MVNNIIGKLLRLGILQLLLSTLTSQSNWAEGEILVRSTTLSYILQF